MNRLLESASLASALLCAAFAEAGEYETATDGTLAVEDRVAAVQGLAGPEAVHWDADQQVWFVSNFNGEAAGDANGFISRVAADGELLEREFMTGTPDHPLHGPRGMRIAGDRLWVADAEGLHAFDRRSGEHVEFIDFSAHDPGFLNDVEIGPDGAIYLTDTGDARLFRVIDGEITVVADDGLVSPPNGVAWFPEKEAMVLAPWGGGLGLLAYRPRDGEVIDVGALPAGGNMDGIEPYRGGLLIASQVDQAIWFWRDGEASVLIETPGRPADIGLDAPGGRIAVPYIALDRVDVWELPDLP
ncbi:MAG: SMP-30/gluconolactonase/LRE family protein [Candidatus Wenzhouxiangella sp. M2_3B_020]